MFGTPARTAPRKVPRFRNKAGRRTGRCLYWCPNSEMRPCITHVLHSNMCGESERKCFQVRNDERSQRALPTVCVHGPSASKGALGQASHTSDARGPKPMGPAGTEPWDSSKVSANQESGRAGLRRGGRIGHNDAGANKREQRHKTSAIQLRAALSMHSRRVCHPRLPRGTCRSQKPRRPLGARARLVSFAPRPLLAPPWASEGAL